MRKAVTIAAATLLTAVCGGFVTAAPAQAQLGSVVPVRAKLGVLLPQDGDTKDFGGDVLYGGELDVTVPLPGAGQTVFTAGYYEGRNSGRKYRVIPLTISQVFSPPNPAAGLTGNVYFGLGAGAYLLRASGEGESEEKTTFGGFALAGYQFPNAFFVEGKYHVAGSVGGLSPNGLSFTLGRRF